MTVGWSRHKFFFAQSVVRTRGEVLRDYRFGMAAEDWPTSDLWTQQPGEVLELLYQDDDLVVIEKPSGMLSVPGRGPEKVDSAAHRIRLRFPNAPAHPEVHRLDMDTSGLMVFALNQAAHRHLSIQFQNRTVTKRYEALLEGILEGNEGSLSLPFRLDVENRPIQIYDEVHGKIGVTRWKKIGIEGNYTRVSFEPLTGRTHQLRVHSAHPRGLGIPIVGDPFYGTGTGPGQLKLHACFLTFTHPTTGERLSFESTAPF